MTEQEPKPIDSQETQPRRRNIFEEIQAKYRSNPWNNNGERFGYIDFKPPVLPDLYGPRHAAAERAHDEAVEGLPEQAFKLAQNFLEKNPRR